jgi:hypothetical protein
MEQLLTYVAADFVAENGRPTACNNREQKLNRLEIEPY